MYIDILVTIRISMYIRTYTVSVSIFKAHVTLCIISMYF